MQSRFTSKAQEALNYAADTAAMLGHGYIGSEHLLIGLIKAEGGLASSVLLSNDITDEKIINLVCQLIAPDSVAYRNRTHFNSNNKRNRQRSFKAS